MKILYAIQGTGNGHLARASEIVPLLQEMAETDILISGTQADIELPFKVKYRFYGISFIFGKHGGVNVAKTIVKLKPLQFIRDLIQLPVHNYDLVISDFEPVTAWACKLKGKKSIGLSHQNAVLHKKAPKPLKRDWPGELVLRYYAPTHTKYGFHFKKLDAYNFTPVIRQSIKNAVPRNNKHYTVYLPAYCNQEIEKALSAFRNIKWEVFSKHTDRTYQVNNIHFNPVSTEKFNHSFVHSEGILCNAGFETPAEALFMGKKLCVIPMKYQLEQDCNAQFLKDMGILVLPELQNQKLQLQMWINGNNVLQIKYKHEIESILHEIILEARQNYTNKAEPTILSSITNLLLIR